MVQIIEVIKPVRIGQPVPTHYFTGAARKAAQAGEFNHVEAVEKH